MTVAHPRAQHDPIEEPLELIAFAMNARTATDGGVSSYVAEGLSPVHHLALGDPRLHVTIAMAESAPPDRFGCSREAGVQQLRKT